MKTILVVQSDQGNKTWDIMIIIGLKRKGEADEDDFSSSKRSRK